jgi:hypothetical protein
MPADKRRVTAGGHVGMRIVRPRRDLRVSFIDAVPACGTLRTWLPASWGLQPGDRSAPWDRCTD